MEKVNQIQQTMVGMAENVTAEKLKSIKEKLKNTEMDYEKKTALFINVQVQQKMLDYFENATMETWPIITDIQPQYKNSKNSLSQIQCETDESEEQHQDCITAAYANYNEIKEKILEYEKKLSIMNERKQKLATLEKKQKEALEDLEQRGIKTMDVADALQKQTEMIANLANKQEDMQRVIVSMVAVISKLKKDCKEMERLIDGLSETICEHKTHTLHNVDTVRKEKESAVKLVEILNKLGLELIEVKDLSLTVHIVSSVQKSVTADLTLYFKEKNAQCVLQGAEINQADLSISELVAQAVECNNPLLLITECKQLINSHAPLLEEVETLRHRYAIDYQHDEGILRVMLGSSGQIVCTLTIEGGYPQRGNITLNAMEGFREVMPLTDLKPAKENPTLTDWLEYLQELTSSF